MGNKIYDDDTGEYADDFQKVNTNTRSIDRELQKRDASVGLGCNIESIVGVCATCEYYKYAENETHELIFSFCNRYSVSVGKQRIKYCNTHEAKGQMSLADMYQIATLIDPMLMKDKPGFIK